MADTISRERRSFNMSRIRSKNTKPEILVRSQLHRCGFRFTVNGPKNKKLPGKPDLVMPAHKTVVFIHGCFWHGHEGCKNFRIPKTRSKWWKEKIFGNRERDSKAETELTESGWNVLIIWECAVKRFCSCRSTVIKKLIQEVSCGAESSGRLLNASDFLDEIGQGN